MKFEETPEYQFGDTAQRKWGEHLRELGRSVMPAYAFKEMTAETKSPVLLIPQGLLVTPDLLSFSIDKGPSWHEVKAKSVPTWHRNSGRWEHGFDFSLLSEYERVRDITHLPIFIVVNERAGPMNPLLDSELLPADNWLWLSLGAIKALGEHRPDWPGGKSQPNRRGRHGKGGWLWPRIGMSIARSPSAPADTNSNRPFPRLEI
jgi:hypothetical protein